MKKKRSTIASTKASVTSSKSVQANSTSVKNDELGMVTQDLKEKIEPENLLLPD